MKHQQNSTGEEVHHYVADAECIPSLKELCCSAIKIGEDTSGRQRVTKFSNEVPIKVISCKSECATQARNHRFEKSSTGGVRWVDTTKNRELTTKHLKHCYVCIP